MTNYEPDEMGELEYNEHIDELAKWVLEIFTERFEPPGRNEQWDQERSEAVNELIDTAVREDWMLEDHERTEQIEQDVSDRVRELIRIRRQTQTE
jgi:hypothetical protein